MKELIKDYERSIEVALIKLKNCPLDIEKETILSTRINCYRVFIIELKRELKEME